jgi:branched-chain amino acid transport system substrate-binding protein
MHRSLRTRLRLTAGLVSVALVVAACGGGSSTGGGGDAAPGVTKDSIKIGIFGALSGAASWVGLGSRDGFKLAVEQINAQGGVNGRKIEVVSVDDQGTAAGAATAARELVQRNKVFALIGGSTSTAVAAVVNFAQQQGVPLIGSGTGGDAIVNPLRSDVFVGYGPPNTLYGKITADFVTSYLKGAGKRIAMINATDEQPQSTSNAAADALKADGVSLVARAQGKLGDTDWTSQLLTVKKAHPDIVLLNVYTAEAAIILKEAKQLGITAQFVGDPATTTSSIVNVAGSSAEGYLSGYLLTDLIENPSTDVGKSWVQTWKKAYPSAPEGRPNFEDGTGFATAYVLAEGLKNAGKDLTRASLVTGLEKIQNYTAPGPYYKVSFSSGNHVAGQHLSFAVVKNGVFTLVPWNPSTS